MELHHQVESLELVLKNSLAKVQQLKGEIKLERKEKKVYKKELDEIKVKYLKVEARATRTEGDLATLKGKEEQLKKKLTQTIKDVEISAYNVFCQLRDSSLWSASMIRR